MLDHLTAAYLIGQIPHIAAAGLIATDPFDFITSNLITAHRRRGRLSIGTHIVHQLAIMKGARRVHVAHLVQDLQAFLRAQKVVHHGQSILIHVIDYVTTKIFIATFTVNDKEKKKKKRK